MSMYEDASKLFQLCVSGELGTRRDALQNLILILKDYTGNEFKFYSGLQNSVAVIEMDRKFYYMFTIDSLPHTVRDFVLNYIKSCPEFTFDNFLLFKTQKVNGEAYDNLNNFSVDKLIEIMMLVNPTTNLYNILFAKLIQRFENVEYILLASDNTFFMEVSCPRFGIGYLEIPETNYEVFKILVRYAIRKMC